jgi:hypothetical protein
MAINKGERESGEEKPWLPLQLEILMVQFPSIEVSPYSIQNEQLGNVDCKRLCI